MIAEDGGWAMDRAVDGQRMRQRIAELLAVARGMTDRVEIKRDDDFALMALCYLSKQIDHAQSVIMLGESPDTVLIVRAMLEGLCQLKWAAQTREARAKRWRDFVWVHDWRALRARMAQGEPCDVAVVATIQEGLDEFGSTFLKEGRTVPVDVNVQQGDPFHPSWTCTGVDRIFGAVGGEALYAVYKSFSDWQHWSMGGIGRSLSPSPDGMNYLARDSRWELAALALTFQCLWETAELVNGHLNFGLGDQLDHAHDQWLREVSANLSTAASDNDVVAG